MQEDNHKIIGRFFKALDVLITRKHIRGYATFAKLYGADVRNFLRLAKVDEDGMGKAKFHVAFLTYLVKDFGVNPVWLLTGKGKMFLVEIEKREKHSYPERVTRERVKRE